MGMQRPTCTPSTLGFNSEGPNSLKTARSSSFYSVHLVNERTSAWLIHIPFFLITSLSWLVKPSSFVAWLWLRDPMFGEPSMVDAHPIFWVVQLSVFVGQKQDFFWVNTSQVPSIPIPQSICRASGVVRSSGRLRSNDSAVRQGEPRSCWGRSPGNPEMMGKSMGKIDGILQMTGKSMGKAMVWCGLWFMMVSCRFSTIPLREKMWAMGIFQERRFAWLAILNKNGGILPSKQNISRFLLA